MKKIHQEQLKKIKKKAKQSSCNYKIAAFAFSQKGNLLGKSVNRSRFYRKGGGLHAEMLLMAKYGSAIKTILIARVGSGGDLRPIKPCMKCKNKAEALSIKIKTVF